MAQLSARLAVSNILFSLTFMATVSATGAPLLDTPLGSSCPLAFQKLPPSTTEQNAILDELIDIENELNGLRDGFMPTVHDAPTRVAYRQLRSTYESVSNRIFDHNDFTGAREKVAELRERVRELRRPAWVEEKIQKISNEPSFAQLTEMPQLIKRDVAYEVPQPCCTTGQREVNQMSVSFSDEVIEYFKKDVDGAHRFLRAIQKGYSASYAGSGIMRFPQYGKLVEIKLVHSKGNYRLLGCREANGLIRLLKFMEKRHHNAADMKPFAHLCD